MPVRPTIDSSSLRLLSKALADIDPALRRQVGKDIKNALRPTAARMLSDIPTTAPLSGMKSRGRLAYGKPTASVYATPGSGSGSIARIEIYARSTTLRTGFKMADLAGTKNAGERFNRGYQRGGPRPATVRPHPTRAGDALIANLKRRYPLSAGGKGGRFGWAQFMKNRPFLISKVLDIINDYVDTVNRKGLR